MCLLVDERSSCSSDGNLYRAIDEVAEAVKQQLQGRRIDFCQLFVSTAHKSNLGHAPACLQDKLFKDVAEGSRSRPVILGGALQSVSANGRMISNGPGVSLLAASLPGVQLLPFHVKEPALPSFTAEQWKELLQRPSTSTDGSSSSSSSSSDAQQQNAAILLSSPHFVDVEKFLLRLSAALPGMPMVGGVTERGAWVESEHDFGALFCNQDVYAGGAVGCIMRGPLSMQQVLVPGCRTAGAVMTVTEAAGNVIFALDDRPVHDSFVTLVHSLPQQDQKRELLLGLCDPGAAAAAGHAGSRDFVARRVSLMPTAYSRPVLVVATHEVPVGTRVRLLMRDNAFNQQQQQAEFAALAARLPAADSRLGVLSYGCVALPLEEQPDAAACFLPQVPSAGGRMQGEFAGTLQPPAAVLQDGSAAAAAAGAWPGVAQLHSFAASYAILQHSSTAPSSEM
ncbi:hypothetical protein OEZ85_011862 [Tetradesmus obliquus]|uniref:FIST domain-containing protein n=1 Tax=Tetradesmus obliquus TaxID=3088 RepID=A0ABY8TTR8_TETOB|nr:hypothetical protein OEZ85_011862 [Tetradesmus obliquus]